MNKNRRKTIHSPFQTPSNVQMKSSQIWSSNHVDKENQAKLILLDIENDDNMLQLQSTFAEQTNNRNSLLGQMMAHQTKQLAKNTSKNILSAHELNALMPIDTNFNFELNNFLQDKPPRTASTKVRFSMKNVIITQSKENILPPSKDKEDKKEQKTIFKLKKILKKLQSPQKAKNQPQKGQYSIIEGIMNRKKSTNKITQYCAQFMCKNASSLKEKNDPEYGSHKKPLQNDTQQSIKFYDFRSGSKTSHERRRSSLGKPSSSGTSTPMAFFYKASKLTNQNMLFKRNSITAGELMKQNNVSGGGFRKSTARVSHQVSRGIVQKEQFEEIFLRQERIKEERKNRNLRNILFD